MLKNVITNDQLLCHVFAIQPLPGSIAIFQFARAHNV